MCGKPLATSQNKLIAYCKGRADSNSPTRLPCPAAVIYQVDSTVSLHVYAAYHSTASTPRMCGKPPATSQNKFIAAKAGQTATALPNCSQQLIADEVHEDMRQWLHRLHTRVFQLDLKSPVACDDNFLRIHVAAKEFEAAAEAAIAPFQDSKESDDGTVTVLHLLCCAVGDIALQAFLPWTHSQITTASDV